MNYFSNIIPKYSYHYFDMDNQFQTKQLNIFQCFVRKVFGCYAETHLSSVAKKGYAITLNDQFQPDPTKRQELLKLIAKAVRVYGYNQSWAKLPSCNLPSGSELSVSVRYVITNSENISGNCKISSIDFKLIFSRNNLVQKTFNIAIFKNKSQRIEVLLPLKGIWHDSENSIELNLNSEYAKTIIDLVAKVLNDSPSFPEMDEIQYYDYRAQFHADTDGQLLPPRQRATFDVKSLKREYRFTKEAAVKNQNLTALGFNQKLSAAFAASFF